MKLKLIPEWRKALHMFSIQLNLIGTTMSSVYAAMYDKLSATVTPKTMACLTIGVFVASALARLIEQELKEDSDAIDK
jgi:hypothetical protein